MTSKARSSKEWILPPCLLGSLALGPASTPRGHPIGPLEGSVWKETNACCQQPVLICQPHKRDAFWSGPLSLGQGCGQRQPWLNSSLQPCEKLCTRTTWPGCIRIPNLRQTWHDKCLYCPNQWSFRIMCQAAIVNQCGICPGSRVLPQWTLKFRCGFGTEAWMEADRINASPQGLEETASRHPR